MKEDKVIFKSKKRAMDYGLWSVDFKQTKKMGYGIWTVNHQKLSPEVQKKRQWTVDYGPWTINY
jgi:hypothetical protein